MTRREQLLDLRDRLAKATGPDRELDIAIDRALIQPSRGKDWWPSLASIKEFTGSIDAAVTLEVAWLIEVEVIKFAAYTYVLWVPNEDPDTHVSAQAKTEALARCLVRVEYELSQTDEAQK